MRIREILEAVKLNELLNLPKPNQQQRPVVVQPAAVTQQQKVDQLVAKIAASDAHRAPTEEEKVLAMWKYMDIKQQAEDALQAQQQGQKPQPTPVNKPKQG